MATNEASMCAINRDKAQFHRKQKDKIARRARNRERLRSVTVESKPAVRAPKQKGVLA
jgi:hypothetical protein